MSRKKSTNTLGLLYMVKGVALIIGNVKRVTHQHHGFVLCAFALKVGIIRAVTHEHQ